MIKDEKYDNYEKLAVHCKCGHSMIIKNGRGYYTCKWCGRLVFASKRIEMKYRQREILAKLKEDIK